MLKFKTYLMQYNIIAYIVVVGILVISLILTLMFHLLQEKSTMAYSFSRLQLWIWTMVICPVFVLHWGHNGAVTAINTTGLILLGMATGTSITSMLITEVRRTNNKALKFELESRNFWADILSDSSGQPSLARLQQLLFTLIYVVIYIAMFFKDYQYPDFDSSAFYLMGISQGGYVISRFLE